MQQFLMPLSVLHYFFVFLAVFASALSDATLLANPQELSKVLQARCSYVIRAEKKGESEGNRWAGVLLISMTCAFQ